MQMPPVKLAFWEITDIIHVAASFRPDLRVADLASDRAASTIAAIRHGS